MIVQQLRKFGLNPDVLQVLGLASIGGSILTWRRAKASDDVAHGERLGIFLGLWAPTFFILASQIDEGKDN